MNKNIFCSIERAKEELGYYPTVSLAEGIRRSITDLLQRGETICFSLVIRIPDASWIRGAQVPRKIAYPGKSDTSANFK